MKLLLGYIATDVSKKIINGEVYLSITIGKNMIDTDKMSTREIVEKVTLYPEYQYEFKDELDSLSLGI